MSKHLIGTRAQCDAWKAAIDQDAGMPIRGVTIGGPERVHPTIPGPGWTIDICLPVIAASSGQAVLEVPDDVLPRLGRMIGPTTLPPQANAVDVTALPPPLRTLVYARQGKDASGTPILPAQAQGQPAITKGP